MPPSYECELKTAIEAVLAASAVCRTVQASITPSVLEKKDRSPVTVADFASQAIICRTLKDVFADDPVIGEEDSSQLSDPECAGFLVKIGDEVRRSGIEASDDEVRQWIDRGSESEYSSRFWTLDPIDGTKGFLRGDQYAVSLALIVDGRIEVGVLGCPNLSTDVDSADGKSIDVKTGQPAGVVFHAVRGGGSWMCPLDGDHFETAVRVADTENVSEARFCESVESAHSSHSISARVATKLGISREPVRMDSQAKYASVAVGQAEIYLRLPAKLNYREKIWDHAGGVLVVEEAGGKVTDVMGKPLDFTYGDRLMTNRGVIATNRRLHARVLKALEEVYEEQKNSSDV